MSGQYNYIESFVSTLRSKGRYTFSLPEIRSQFEQSDEAIDKAIQRVTRKGEIALLRNEFYVIVTPEHKHRGIPPPSLFIADLMRFLERDYYVALLNAAAYYGAAHQQPQSFSVITVKPSLRSIETSGLKINFYIKRNWNKLDVQQRKVDTGYINVSSPELTALDLVSYVQQAGGFNRVVTILEELSESMDADKLVATAKRFPTITTVQRLGYLLEEVLGLRSLSEPLKNYLQTVTYFPVLLSTKRKKSNMVTGNDWKVVKNVVIETD